jgi:NAD(P)H dehydrogenase (quinone)
MHVLSVFSHPHRNSFSGALLDSFVRGAADAGHTSEIADLYREDFNPVMSQRDLQQFDNVVMPDDVLREQARVERSDALCFIFPIWWYSMPAMIKGWLDRVWSAGWAYQPAYTPEGSLLDSRPCTLLVPTGATPSHMEQWRYDQESITRGATAYWVTAVLTQLGFIFCSTPRRTPERGLTRRICKRSTTLV